MKMAEKKTLQGKKMLIVFSKDLYCGACLGKGYLDYGFVGLPTVQTHDQLPRLCVSCQYPPF